MLHVVGKGCVLVGVPERDQGVTAYIGERLCHVVYIASYLWSERVRARRRITIALLSRQDSASRRANSRGSRNGGAN
ncbi:MAG: hypothetical protein KatS3mg056_3629 [Chloroflexus sp.]|nr:MAG: hypothetical protein KatS3mg056_3629 [Chloroflexus sp.]